MSYNYSLIINQLFCWRSRCHVLTFRHARTGMYDLGFQHQHLHWLLWYGGKLSPHITLSWHDTDGDIYIEGSTSELFTPAWTVHLWCNMIKEKLRGNQPYSMNYGVNTWVVYNILVSVMVIMVWMSFLYHFLTKTGPHYQFRVKSLVFMELLLMIYLLVVH